MTKVRTLELVLTPAIRCMLRAQPHVNGDGVIVEIPPSEVDFPGTDVLMRVQTQELLAKRVQALQPLLRRKGASGCFYSRRALSQICRVPYHLLKPHDEHKPVSQARMLREKRRLVQSSVDISQTSLQMQAHLSLAQRAVLMNRETPDA